MDSAIKLRSFEGNYKVLVATLFRHEKILSSDEYGKGTLWIMKLIELHEQNHIESVETVEKSQQLFHFGNSISTFGSDSVLPKCQNLENIICSIKNVARKRKTHLELSLSVSRDIEQANIWWENASKLLCKVSSLEFTAENRESDSVKILEVKLNDVASLRIMREEYSPFVVSLFGEKIKKTNEEIKELCDQFEKRIQFIKREVTPKPIQTVEPRLADNKSDVCNAPTVCLLSARSARTRRSNQDEVSVETARTDVELIDDSSDDQIRMPNEAESSQSEEEQIPQNPPLSSSQSSLSADETDHSRVNLIIEELINTEEIYIKETGEILTGYGNQIDAKPPHKACPEVLRGNSRIILGNMDDIYSFHKELLLPSLLKAEMDVNRIGRAFLEHATDFEIYSIYCRNSKKSEELRRILGKNGFLKSCQDKLQHALPLSGNI